MHEEVGLVGVRAGDRGVRTRAEVRAGSRGPAEARDWDEAGRGWGAG